MLSFWRGYPYEASRLLVGEEIRAPNLVLVSGILYEPGPVLLGGIYLS